MNTERNGGNPLLDRREAEQRFKMVVKPSLEKLGFLQSKGNAWTMCNPTNNTVVIPISAPSNFKIEKAIAKQVRDYRKQFNNPSIYVLFTRPFNEWKSKDTYVAKLKKIMGMNLLDGVSVGLNSLSTVLTMIEDKECYRLTK